MTCLSLRQSALGFNTILFILILVLVNTLIRPTSIMSHILYYTVPAFGLLSIILRNEIALLAYCVLLFGSTGLSIIQVTFSILTLVTPVDRQPFRSTGSGPSSEINHQRQIQLISAFTGFAIAQCIAAVITLMYRRQMIAEMKDGDMDMRQQHHQYPTSPIIMIEPSSGAENEKILKALDV